MKVTDEKQSIKLEQKYQDLVIQYNANKEELKANEKVYNSKLGRYNELGILIAEAEATIQLLDLQLEQENLSNEEDLDEKINQLTQQIIDTQAAHTNMEIQLADLSKKNQICIQEKKSQLEELKKQLQNNEEQEGGNFQKTIEEKLKKQIQYYENQIEEKNYLKEQMKDPKALIRLENQYEDFCCSENRLQEQLQLKTQQQKIGRNKVVIEYNRLEVLKEKQKELSQQLKALKHHSQQIGTRISAMRKQEKKVNDSLKKNKKLLGSFPVREQIVITQKQNHLLQLDLEKQEKKLGQIIEVKEKSLPLQEYKYLCAEHEELKHKIDNLQKEIAVNRKLKESQKNLVDQVQKMEDVFHRSLGEKKKQLKNFEKKMKEMEEQKQTVDKTINDDSNLLSQYIKEYPGHSKDRKRKKEEEEKSDLLPVENTFENKSPLVKPVNKSVFKEKSLQNVNIYNQLFIIMLFASIAGLLVFWK